MCFLIGQTNFFFYSLFLQLITKDGSKFETPAPDWNFMTDPHADENIKGTDVFWYNSKTAEALWSEPDWDKIWSTRRQQSRFVKSDDSWEVFEDPEGRIFYYSMTTGEYQWDTSNVQDYGEYYDY